MNNLNRMIQAVALDMDGLTLNTEDLYEEVGQELMARRGKLYRDEVRQQMMGLPAPQAYAVLIHAEGLTDSWQALQQESDQIFESILPTRVQPMPGLLELLDELDRLALPRCVATSSTASFAKKALGFAGVLPRVDFVLTPDDVVQGKPAPDIYCLAAKRMNTQPNRMLVLEDSSVGTRAGVLSGAHVISVPSRHTQGSNFQGARQVVPSLNHSIILDTLHSVLGEF